MVLVPTASLSKLSKVESVGRSHHSLFFTSVYLTVFYLKFDSSVLAPWFLVPHSSCLPKNDLNNGHVHTSTHEYRSSIEEE